MVNQRLVYFLLPVLVAALSGCSGGSSDTPTANDPVPKLTIEFQDMGRLAGQQTQIAALVENTFAEVETELTVLPVTVLISADASRTIPGWGMGGFALGPDTVELVIDSDYANLPAALDERLPYIVAHELHHVVRWRSQGVYETLLEALVFEGMADDFALGLLGGEPPPWTMAIPEEDAGIYAERALPILDNPVPFNTWFLGSTSDLPVWTGYTLGRLIVSDYRRVNTEASLSDLAATPAESFRAFVTATGSGFVARVKSGSPALAAGSIPEARSR